MKAVNQDIKVGIAKNIVWYETWKNEKGKSNILSKVMRNIIKYLTGTFFLRPIRKHLDFIGVNYYFTAWIKNFKENNPHDNVNDLGWTLHAPGIKPALLSLKKYKLPIYITEHGLADAWDQKRPGYIKESLAYIYEAMQEGADVKGYLHWSLIDNFEWHIGFWPKFGLIEIDRDHNLARRPRPSYYMYSQICKTGTVE
jgi:beta-glucosidase/6-phospho-beta-glucosidase/beta-galactosidase